MPKTRPEDGDDNVDVSMASAPRSTYGSRRPRTGVDGSCSKAKRPRDDSDDDTSRPKTMSSVSSTSQAKRGSNPWFITDERSDAKRIHLGDEERTDSRSLSSQSSSRMSSALLKFTVDRHTAHPRSSMASGQNMLHIARPRIPRAPRRNSVASSSRGSSISQACPGTASASINAVHPTFLKFTPTLSQPNHNATAATLRQLTDDIAGMKGQLRKYKERTEDHEDWFMDIFIRLEGTQNNLANAQEQVTELEARFEALEDFARQQEEFNRTMHNEIMTLAREFAVWRRGGRTERKPR